jgi:hypothetical protein
MFRDQNDAVKLGSKRKHSFTGVFLRVSVSQVKPEAQRVVKLFFFERTAATGIYPPPRWK